VFGCTYERIADESCSESTLRRRREEWIEEGLMDRPREICLVAYDHLIGPARRRAVVPKTSEAPGNAILPTLNLNLKLELNLVHSQAHYKRSRE
jgi:hypothetical protein